MSALDTLKKAARSWARKVVALHNTPVPAGAMAVEKARLLSYAQTVKNTVEGVLGKLDEFGELEEINQLGILPLIPVAVIAGATTAIAKWVYDYASFSKKLDAYNDLTAGGLTHSAALNVVDKSAGGGTGILNSIAAGATLPLIGAALLFGYMVLK